MELNAKQNQYKRLALHLQLDCNSTICLLLPLFTLNTKHIQHNTYSGKRNKKINFAFKKSLNPPLKCSPESHKGTLFNQHFRRGLNFYARQILCSSSSFGSPLLWALSSIFQDRTLISSTIVDIWVPNGALLTGKLSVLVKIHFAKPKKIPPTFP